MCDSSITTSRVCWVVAGQNSLFSIVLGVILKCYHFLGCSCCYNVCCWIKDSRELPALRGLTPARCLSASGWKQSLPPFRSQNIAAWFFFFPWHLDLTHRRQQCEGLTCSCQDSWYRTACGHIASASLPLWGHPHHGELAQVSCVAPCIPLESNYSSSLFSSKCLK